jgi:hypothetical protein
MATHKLEFAGRWIPSEVRVLRLPSILYRRENLAILADGLLGALKSGLRTGSAKEHVLGKRLGRGNAGWRMVCRMRQRGGTSCDRYRHRLEHQFERNLGAGGDYHILLRDRLVAIMKNA